MLAEGQALRRESLPTRWLSPPRERAAGLLHSSCGCGCSCLLVAAFASVRQRRRDAEQGSAAAFHSDCAAWRRNPDPGAAKGQTPTCDTCLVSPPAVKCPPPQPTSTSCSHRPFAHCTRDATHHLLQVLVDGGRELAGLVEAGAKQTGNLLDDRVRSQESVVALGCVVERQTRS